MKRIMELWLVLFFSGALIACGAGSSAGPVGVSDLQVDTTFVSDGGSIEESDPAAESSETGSDTEVSDPETKADTPVYGVATLSWTPPTENTDGSVLTDLAGYRIYYSTDYDILLTNPSAATVIKLDSPGVSEYVIENLDPTAVYHFAMISYNSSNIESAMSNIVSKDLAAQ